ncbi:Ca-activated chloride channel family protein [Aliiroseovarius sediminilitoris]|uniref:Ca-activated chloride channel family protein n=1 Tax=Aliiroseovarius sediminilitoris TaxID=1173584 RepID=A0A1I0QIV6_9RHOB|nr:VWA domain-containing protein [Aliiroseovarius sediminilitoris]SEW27058.1 Ca-activated chloride channel family protein [Aliiroseovarius sediminilitoris]
MRYLAALILLVALSNPARAQDRASTVLVLDASGSMWGQIDGTAKITIAQDVLDDLLQTLPTDQALGLTVYGHRRKGDCTDIETLVAPGVGTQTAISTAVNAVKPKGKTPMTDAVIAAAQSLRYTEEKATVILVSDGIETCNPDPCAAARALEEAGVDFTAHVIGFDINDPEAMAQMQCLAEETGGTFRSAANAGELGAALVEIASAPEPEPEPVTISFRATLGKGGPEIDDGLVWSFAPDGTGEQTTPTGATRLELLPGEYTVSVLRLEDELTAETVFKVAEQAKTVTIALPEIAYRASLDAVDTAPIGSTIEVTWDAEIGDNDYVTIVPPEAKPGTYRNYTYISKGNPLPLTMPLTPGTYELRYIRSGSGKQDVTAARSIVVTDLTVTLDAADEIGAGAVLEVAWDGPGYENDYIAITAPDAEDRTYENYAYTNRGNPAEVTSPIEPGAYELRYVAQGNPLRVLARRPITVLPVSASLTAPDQVVAGAAVDVEWEGPDNKNDYISVAASDQEPNKYVNYAYANRGNPVSVTMPLDPGTYELRYIAHGKPAKIIATRPVTVVAAQVTIEAQSDAVAGSDVEVTWDGPDNKNDYISVASADQPPNKYVAYVYTQRGNPAAIKMPLDPGTYQLRYIAHGNPAKVLAAREISIVAAQVALEAVDTAEAGASIDVIWQGPDNKNDYVAVAAPDQPVNKYTSYAYTSRGNPSKITLPLEPGTYQLRYIANGSPQRILATRDIGIVAATAALDAPETAVSGTEIDVSFVGPANKNDFVSVAAIGSEPGEHLNYQYAQRGNPVRLKVPVETGTYLIRYIAHGNPKKVLARRMLKVVEASETVVEEAVLEAAESAAAGGQIDVFWVGPDDEGDLIAIKKIGSDTVEASVATASGNPAALQLPNEPGDYMLHYLSGQGQSSIGRRPLSVN